MFRSAPSPWCSDKTSSLNLIKAALADEHVHLIKKKERRGSASGLQIQLLDPVSHCLLYNVKKLIDHKPETRPTDSKPCKMFLSFLFRCGSPCQCHGQFSRDSFLLLQSLLHVLLLPRPQHPLLLPPIPPKQQPQHLLQRQWRRR